MAQSLTSSSPSECDELEGVGGQKRSAKDFNITLEQTSIKLCPFKGIHQLFVIPIYSKLCVYA